MTRLSGSFEDGAVLLKVADFKMPSVSKELEDQPSGWMKQLQARISRQ